MPTLAFLLLFVDGLGLGEPTPENPLASGAMPFWTRLLGGPPVRSRAPSAGWWRGTPWRLETLDATLGVEGLPQSATGQTALLTGENAARRQGFHGPPWPGPTLRRILQEASLLRYAVERGWRVTFANAFSPGYARARARRRLRPSATVLAVQAAGLPLRGERELLAGEAVYWDLTHREARRRLGLDWPLLTPEGAGERLARLASRHHLTLFETFLTDLAGHGRGLEPREVLETLDRFLAGAVGARPPHLTLLLFSDHGNVEAPDKPHTRNPVPLFVLGPAADLFVGVRSLTDLAPRIRRAF